nr:major facilitator superfamily domain, general substrate transporter [Tanacetum cinerariifolium]
MKLHKKVVLPNRSKNPFVVAPFFVERRAELTFLCTIHKKSIRFFFCYCSYCSGFQILGQLEFFYDEATDGTRSLSSAILLSEISIGSWLSNAIVKTIEKGTGKEDKGWLRNDLNMRKLDYLYWILMSITALNLLWI